MRSVGNGDENAAAHAVEDAYRAHYWQVVAYAARRLGSEESGRDAAQETFAVAWRRRDDLPAQPLPWLYGIAANVVANSLRAGRRHDRLTARLQAVPDAPGSEPLPAPAPAYTGTDPILLALSALSDADQEVLRLAAWEDLATAEIAQVIGCSPNTAAARLSRARKRLRTVLDRPGVTGRGNVPVVAPGVTGRFTSHSVDSQEVRRA